MLYYSSLPWGDHGVRVSWAPLAGTHALGSTLTSWGRKDAGAGPQDVLPLHPCLDAGLGQNRQGSFPRLCGPVTASISPSPRSPPPKISRFSQLSATSHQGKNPRGKTRLLTNLEMSEHTPQTAIVIATNYPVVTTTKGSPGRLTPPAKDLAIPLVQSLGEVIRKGHLAASFLLALRSSGLSQHTRN